MQSNMLDTVLLADDDPTMRRFVEMLLKRLGKTVLVAKDGKEALTLLQKHSVDLIISDMKMPQMGGLDLLKALKAEGITTPLLFMTAHASIEAAVDAVKQGALDYLKKPFEPQELEKALFKLEKEEKLQREVKALRAEKTSPLIAKSPAMQKLLSSVKKIAKSPASVFITGESGTGKEGIAAAIHTFSTRNEKPFIKVNCAAIADHLVESEFFGHEKGSFTGAIAKKLGRFELADQGTLLLDEVTEIPLTLQPKLLRAIQEMEFERVGGTSPVRVQVRLVATSNRDMSEAIQQKSFREDLYYRLNVVPLHIPPLRERPEDILPLAEHFLQKACLENHKPLKKLAPSAQKKLLEYPWPGNVRELSNIIERAVVLDFEEVLSHEHLYLDSYEAPQHFQGSTLHELEKKHILETLKKHHQNKTHAAKALGISPRTLRNKLYEYEESPLSDS